MVKPGGQNHPYSHSICLVPGARPLMKPLTKHPIHVPKSLVALKVRKPASQLTNTSTGLGREKVTGISLSKRENQYLPM